MTINSTNTFRDSGGKFIKGMRNDTHYNWKGSQASYRAKHGWVQRHYGKADRCSFDISHTADRFHWSNISGNYARDITDWQMLCPSCHSEFDKKPLPNICKRGHKYTPENTALRTRGKHTWRRCKKCDSIHRQSFKEKLALNA